ncbi:MAG: hypothetical protein P4L99_29705 [Chthoniobacter sp.]|nr:hypothetical protein [Chthoniobacter sp.]
MDLATVILFLILYYLRPQEWSSMFATIHFVQIVMLTALASLFFREQGFRPRDIFRTPHDWAVLAFWLWLVLSAVHPWDTFRDNANLYIFYFVIVQVLSTVPRMKIFAGWWTLLIVVVALLALASQWGFDPLESMEKTMGPMKGRLILNLSIFNNPNGLGHSLVPAIPMLYYYFIWKRPIVSRLIGIGLLFIPLYCIFLTVSKGAFLCAGITVVATMAFGRPKSVQISIGVAAFIFGSTALYMLPRMSELNNSKSDEAIQGRVAAFKHGYAQMQATFRGIGKAEWGKEPFITAYIPTLLPPKMGSGPGSEKGRTVLKPIHYSKAPHSSYVCIGAELGKPGMFLFVAVLYCCLRTTMTAKTQTPDEERIRRMLFVLVISYIVSSWMVDFEYRPTFFMFTAAIAALHRHLLGIRAEEDETVKTPELESLPVWHPPQLIPHPALAAALPDSRLSRDLLAPEPASETGHASAATDASPPGVAGNWNRLGWFDAGMILLLTYGVIRFWAYIMMRM